MGVFGSKNTTTIPSQSSLLLNQYNAARSNLLLVVGFTLFNIILLVTNSNTYFLFSAYIPYIFGDFGMYLCGKYPAEYYGADMADLKFAGNGVFALFIGLAVVFIALYFLCWIFSKKQRVGWMIAALVLFIADTIILLLIGGISVDLMMDYVFHVWVIVSLSRGVVAYFKYKKLPPEEEFENETQAQEVTAENL